MALWGNAQSQKQWALLPDETELLNRVVPRSGLLADMDLAEIWAARKKHAFKPVDSFGSRGVLLGEKISRKRFDELPQHKTLVQEPALLIPMADRPLSPLFGTRTVHIFSQRTDRVAPQRARWESGNCPSWYKCVTILMFETPVE